MSGSSRRDGEKPLLIGTGTAACGLRNSQGATMTTTVVQAQTLPAMTPLTRKDSSGATCQPDYHFRCSNCIKLIAEDAPVYMRHDHWFCSHDCRGRGLSRLYANLKDAQLQEIGRQSSMTTLTTSSRTSRTKSDSSIVSRNRTGSESSDKAGGGRLALFARVGQKVMDVLLQRVASRSWGAKALRTYSSGMLWGRDMTKDTSACTLFSYLPEVDGYLTHASTAQMAMPSERLSSSEDL